MGYQKQNFVSGQVLNSAHLNHIENGIVEVESSVAASLAEKATKEDLTAETTRAQAAEKANADNIAAEGTRAQAAESALSAKITEETTRAKAAEQANAEGIAAEKTRAEQAEQALDKRTAAIESCGFAVYHGKVCMKYRKT